MHPCFRPQLISKGVDDDVSLLIFTEDVTFVYAACKHLSI